MAEESLRSKTVSSVGWKFLGSLTSYGITFIVGIILARLLGPDEYGLIGIILVFVTLFNGIADGGFSTALIREKDVSDIDYSTTFITNFLLSLGLSGGMYLAAPWIADFFGREELVDLSRMMALCVIFNALSIIQQTRLIIELDFKKQTIGTVLASLLSGIVGVLMAYKGFGVWSLVGQQLSRYIFYAVILWLIMRWWPKLVFSIASFRKLWSFGWKILLSSLISNLWNELNQIVIGKCYSSTDLGYYTRGREYVNIASQNLTMVVQTVSYPALSKIQDENERLKSAYKKVIKVTMLVTFVLVFGMAGCAKQLILVLIGEQWLPCVSMLQLTCFSAVLFPLHAINLNMLQVKGRSDIFLKLEIVKKFIGIPPLLIGVFVSIHWMLFAWIISGLLSYYLNAYYSGRLLNYSFNEQLKDLFPSFSISMLMALVVYSLSFLNVSNILVLCLQIIFGAIIVFVLCRYFRLEEYYECVEMAKSYIESIRKII